MIHDLMRFWEMKVVCGATSILETGTNTTASDSLFLPEIVYKIGFQQSRVFESPKEDLWVIISYHESRYSFLKPNLLQENLEYVNQRITLE